MIRMSYTVRGLIPYCVVLEFIASVIVISMLVLTNGALAQGPTEGILTRAGSQSSNVLTQHNDNQRTGANLNETVLTTANVNPMSFGKLFTRTVDGQIYAQPLYVANVLIPNLGMHNVVFVATMHNTVYAFDGDNPAITQPLWQRNLGPTAPSTDFYQNLPFQDFVGEVGVVSTPVIDLNTNTLYVVALTKTVFISNTTVITSYAHSLHALDITTGAEKVASPVIITGTVPGSGGGGLTVSFDSSVQLQRPGLLLSNGVVFITFGSYADLGRYHGWLFGYDATNLLQRYMFNSSPNSSKGSSVWQSGQGVASDTAGNLYFITGNGVYSDTTNDFGDSFVKLNPTNTYSGVLPVADWFTPFNQQYLNSTDRDLGSGGPLLIPETDFLVSGGKEGVFYLINRNGMGHYNPGGPDLIPQSFIVSNNTIMSSPIYWNSPQGPMVYIWSNGDMLKAYQVVVTDTAHISFNTTPVATGSVQAPYPGGMLSLSANGNLTGTGILWASQPLNHNYPIAPGVLSAYDASNVATELWNSAMNQADEVGNFAKFNNPTIANGKVYLATFSNQLVVFGLIQKLFLPFITK